MSSYHHNAHGRFGLKVKFFFEKILAKGWGDVLSLQQQSRLLYLLSFHVLPRHYIPYIFPVFIPPIVACWLTLHSPQAHGISHGYAVRLRAFFVLIDGILQCDSRHNGVQLRASCFAFWPRKGRFLRRKTLFSSRENFTFLTKTGYIPYENVFHSGKECIAFWPRVWLIFVRNVKFSAREWISFSAQKSCFQRWDRMESEADCDAKHARWGCKAVFF